MKKISVNFFLFTLYDSNLINKTNINSDYDYIKKNYTIKKINNSLKTREMRFFILNNKKDLCKIDRKKLLKMIKIYKT